MLTRIVLALFAALLVAPAAASADVAGTTLLQSRPDGLGVLPAADVNYADAGERALSADGCKTVFVSGADGLVATADDDPHQHIYLRDRCTDTTTLVSRTAGGVPGNETSHHPTISADGNRVAFVSYAANLAGGKSLPAVIVRDLVAGTTEAIATVDWADRVALDGTGRRVGFLTTARLDAANDPLTSSKDAYVHDRQAATNTLISRSADGGQATGGVTDVVLSEDGTPAAFVTGGNAFLRSGASTTLVSIAPGTTTTAMGGVTRLSMSADAAVVAFETTANAGPDTNNAKDVYLRGATATARIGVRAEQPALSRDGTRIAFASTDAGNAPLDTNLQADVFVRTIESGVTVIASRGNGATGALGDQQSGLNAEGAPSLDATGSVVVFDTYARNLTFGGDPDFRRVLARDVAADTTELVSRPTGDAPFTTGVSRTENQPAADGMISGDGRYVVFASESDNLSTQDDDRYSNIFIRDNRLDKTTLVASANAYSESPVISSDGRRVAFVSYAAFDAARDRNGTSDVYVKDLESGTLELVSRGDGNAISADFDQKIALDIDGSVVAFVSRANVGDDVDGKQDVYVRNLDDGTLTLASRGSVNSTLEARQPSLDGAGDTVAFSTYGALIGDDTDSDSDVYVRELGAGTTEIVSRPDGTGAQGAANGQSNETAISADGRKVAFIATGDNLSPQDASTNMTPYVRDRDANTTKPYAGAAGNATFVSLSDDGSTIAFVTDGKLDPTDIDAERDVYVRPLAGGDPILASRGPGTAGTQGTGRMIATSPSLNWSGSCVAFSGVRGAFTPATYPTADFEQVYLRVVSGECPDETAPETSIEGDPPARTAAAKLDFTFQASENGAEFECKLDQGEWERCEAPHEVADLAEGPHTFSVRAFDSAENRDPEPAAHGFVVDRTAPVTTLTGPSGKTGASPTFTIGANETAVFSCKVDNGDWNRCAAPAVTLEDLADGPHTFAVKAADEVGNEDATPETLAFVIDSAAPGLQLTSATATDDGVARIAFTSSEDGATFRCSIDGGPLKACTSPFEVSGLAVGAHTFRIKASDEAGNESAALTGTVTVPAKPVVKEDPKKDEPKKDEPKKDAPKQEAPKTEAPKIEVPKQEVQTPRLAQVAVATVVSKAVSAKRGVATVVLSCAGPAPCTGTLTASAKKLGTVGRASFTVGAGKRATVTLKLSKEAAKALKGSKKLARTIVVKVG